MSSIEERLSELSSVKRALLTKRLQQKRLEDARKSAIPKRTIVEIYPMSYAQQRLWFLYQFDPQSPFYNIPTAIRIRGSLDINALKKSLLEVVQRHEVLRSNYITEEGKPVQVITPEVNLGFDIHDFQRLAESDREAQAIIIATEEAQKPFDLSRDHLVRAKLIQLAPEEFIFLLTIHHIVFDGWSNGILINEVVSCYDAFTSGKEPALKALEIQYADYAAWQREWLEGDLLHDQLEYWRNQLKDIPPVLNLPTDYPRPAVQTFHGAYHKFDFPGDVLQNLKLLTRKENVTLFMVSLAIFQTILSRYSGQTDISVGSPIAYRNRRELENLIGLFTTMLVMRTDLSGDPTFQELLQRVKEVVLGAQTNQDIPFEMLVDDLNIERDMSHTPLFQTALVYQQMPTNMLELKDLKLSIIDTDAGTVKIDLALVIEEGRDNLSGTFRFNTDLFDRTTISRMAEQFLRVTESLLRDPTQKISKVPLISQDERDLLLSTWNETETSIPPISNIVELFEQVVEKSPGAIAIQFPKYGYYESDEETLTYHELNRRANKLAHYLIESGIKPDDLVGLFIDRSIDMIIGLIGILKAGAAYLPLSTDYPMDRLAYMIEDANTQIILTNSKLLNHLPENSANIVLIDSEWHEIDKKSDANPSVRISKDSLVYVIYTSGSTGKSKGVLVKQHGLINHAVYMRDKYGVGAGDRVLQFITISFDAAAEEIYPALISGATLVLIHSAEELVGNRLIEFCRDQSISILHLPAAVWHQALDEFIAKKQKFEAPIRLLILGGDTPDLVRLNAWSQTLDNPVRFINAYGPTETTITATQHEILCVPGSLENYVRIPIGRPIANMKTYILDDQLEPVPIGIPGELFIGGAGIARGYLNRPELTTDRFIKNPFSDDADELLYRTGDKVKYLLNGNIEFIGRIDYQVKVRGFRIEMGEVESTLLGYEKIKDAVVIAKESNSSEKRLIGYVISLDSKITVGDIRDYLQTKLPDYMIPSNFIIMDEFPLLPNGKIDRKSLPDPEDQRPELIKAYVPPRDPLEVKLTQMWKELLGITQVGVFDNFFELGGNSILGATFINKLQDEMGEYIYLIAIFDSPTISELAEYLRVDYPTGVARLTDEPIPEEITKDQESTRKEITSDQIAQLRNLIITLPGREDISGDQQPKNPQSVFILSAPRSGSTLLRVMLGGNPALFSPPELQLMNYNTLADQAAAFALERDAFWLDGTYQALIALKNCELDEAQEIMEAYREARMPVKRFFGLMQEWLGDRIFVDKTPNYSLDMKVLDRIEQDFEDPLYIHLIRHPYAVIPSFEKARLHVFYPPFFSGEHSFSSYQLAELVWVISHQNITQFLKAIPENRQYRIKYEDMVGDPEKKMVELCEFIGIDFHPDMLEPQKNPKLRMTEAIHPLAKMVGDVRFFEHHGIDDRNAYRWMDKLSEDYLSDITWDLALEFGYDRNKVEQIATKKKKPPTAQGLDQITTVDRDQKLELSFSQQRLWFLDHLEQGGAHYNMPAAMRLLGSLKLDAMEFALNELMARHEILRISFVTEDGKPQLNIAENTKIYPSIIDLSDLDQDLQHSEILRQVAALSQKPFNLAKGPLLRINILQLNQNEHIAVLVFHHIISDGWSIGIFVREFAALYQAYIDGNPSPLPPLPIQYVDYANWQRNWLQGEVLEHQLRYWEETLKGSSPLIDIPTDRPRPSIQTSKGKQALFSLNKEISDYLTRLSKEEGVTLFTTLLAAFNVFLFRYSGQDDINIGTPIANRSRAELEDLIGFFVNTLVIRSDLSGDPSFRKLLKRTHKKAVEAFEHQDIPFEMIVDKIQPERNLSHNPLFQVMFVLQNTTSTRLELTGLEINPFEADTGTAKFDLTLSISTRDKVLNGVLEYNTDLYDQSTIDRMIVHFKNLLEGIVRSPDQEISSFSMLDQSETRKILFDWNQTKASFAENLCLHRIIEAQADLYPDATAVIHKENSITYRDLNAQANQLAKHLISIGVGPESLVGLCIGRSIDMIIGMLGILKSGGAYVPIDPSYPAERIAYILAESRAQTVVTKSNYLQHISTPLQTVCMDMDWEHISKHSSLNPTAWISSLNTAYVIFTSGSTGKPKGTLVPHRGLINLVENIIRTKKITSRSKSLQYMSYSFDASVTEIFPPLAAGSTLVIADQDIVLSMMDIHNLLKDHKITHLALTPSVLGVLPENELPDLTSVTSGGEACTWEVVNKWGMGRNFFNVYGPTEATVEVLSYQVDGKISSPDLIPIGRPYRNNSIYILDSHLNPVPVGVAGELCIGGVGITRGYLYRPELTAEKFIPNPYSGIFGDRLYRTGDLARYRVDGEILFLGRIDQQVKIRGFRIELGEIENVLATYPGICDTAVTLNEDTRGNKKLTAYYVPSVELELNISDIRLYLSEKLPEYMVPAFFVNLPELPLSPNGKVDIQSLPKPDLESSESRGEYIAPSSDKEKILASIWSDLLNIKKISVLDNFFELGGDSILSIQVISRANQSGLRLTPKQLFQYPTIKGLAEIAGTAPVIHAEQGLVTGAVPLTPIQKWFFEKQFPHPEHWNQSIMIETRDSLNFDSLKKTIVILLEHHDALRIHFQQVNGEWQQYIVEKVSEVPVHKFDLSAFTAEEQTRQLELKANEIQASINLLQAPLLRVAYFDMGKERSDKLLIVIHHHLIDGISWRILIEDIQTIYQQISEGKDILLQPKSTSFQYWSNKLSDYVESETLKNELAYWMRINDIDFTIPVDFPGNQNLEADSSLISKSLNLPETQALLKDLPVLYGTDMNDVLLAALTRTILNWCKKKKILIDMEGHGREDIFDDVDLSRTVGWFTTVYPLYLHLESDSISNSDLLLIKEQVRSVPIKGFNFGVLYYLNSDNKVYHQMSNLPSAEISLNYLGQLGQILPDNTPFRIANVSKGLERSEQNQRIYKLIIGAFIHDGCLKVNWSYSQKLFRKETIELLASNFMRILKEYIEYSKKQEDIHYTPSDFDDVVLSQDDIEDILDEIGEI